MTDHIQKRVHALFKHSNVLFQSNWYFGR